MSKSSRPLSLPTAAEQPEEPAPASASAVCNIPLDRLVLSPKNVRKTPATPAENAQLKARIRAAGLKQNLVAHRVPGADGTYAVTAGGRRFKALQELAAEGAIPADLKVPCLIEEPEAALETSLMENCSHAAMNAADEFLAMAALIDSGQPVDAIARRFGVSEKHVRQRLRLGKVAPELLDEFRAGAFSLEILTALTLGADHAAQLAVWRQVKDQNYISPHTVRRLLTQSAVPLDSSLGAFVGAAAYEAAGGRITRDLFSGDEDGFMDDAALVNRLAIEKLEAKAAELRPHWAWTKAVLDPDYGFLAHYGRVRPQPAEVPAELAAEIERIEQRASEFEEMDGDAWTDELAAEAAQLEERRTEIDETIEGLAVYAETDRALSGAIVTIGPDGDFRLYEGLVDRPARRGGSEIDASENPDDGAEPASDGFDDAPRSRGVSPSAELALRKACGFSQTLVDDLKAYRLQVTRAYLAGDFAVAFDLALYALCIDLFSLGYRALPLELRATESPLKSTLNDLAGTPADRLLEGQRKTLALDWLELPDAQAFAALTALPAEEKQRLFAWCIALCLKPQLAIEDRADPVIEAAGRRLAISFAECWRPTAANYWGRVKKAHSLATGRQILGERWARDHAEDKKPALAAALEAACDPASGIACIGVGQAEREDAANWLPPGMAYDSGGIGEADDSSQQRPGENRADLEADAIAPIGSDTEEDDAGEITGVADELPAFLIGDEPEGMALNEASVP
ncbi:MAG TPA: ParB N-terminal domain-containing protein [Stellaceae bacterium]|nr:ParB N-terminal domain-containing protein [Stellaceae bacterium]